VLLIAMWGSAIIVLERHRVFALAAGAAVAIFARRKTPNRAVDGNRHGEKQAGRYAADRPRHRAHETSALRHKGRCPPTLI
jgi:hypothetical protein